MNDSPLSLSLFLLNFSHLFEQNSSQQQSRVKRNKTFETLRSGQLRCMKCESLYDQDSCGTIESLITKEESLSLFKALPTQSRNRGKNKRPRFQALSFYDTERSYIGTTQEARRSAFERAVSEENIPRFQILFNMGVDLDEQDDQYGISALMRACLNDSKNLIDALLCAGADVNLKANDGTSALTIMKLKKTMKEQEEEKECDNDVGVRTASITRPKEYTGTIVIDDGFTEMFLNRLLSYCKILPIFPPGKVSCTSRRYLYDFDESICRTIEKVLFSCGAFRRDFSSSFTFPKFRILSYEHVDGFVPPHVDLSRTNRHGVRSTHTLILYLTDCNRGGETRLMHRLPRSGDKSSKEVELRLRSRNSSYDVEPRRGRLLLFPHLQPHEGLPTIDCPKTFLRGEMYIDEEYLTCKPCLM